jgi:hypothetical protein
MNAYKGKQNISLVMMNQGKPLINAKFVVFILLPNIAGVDLVRVCYAHIDAKY